MYILQYIYQRHDSADNVTIVANSCTHRVPDQVKFGEMNLGYAVFDIKVEPISEN